MARKTGRPTKYSKALGDRFCARIAEGESLRTVCDDLKMPAKATVFRWLRLPGMKAFRDQYELATQARADAFAEEMIDIAHETMEGETTTEKMIGDDVEVTVKKEDMLGHRRLLIDTLKWNMSRMNSKRYGDKIDVTSDNKPLERSVSVFDMRTQQPRKADKPKAK